MTNNLITIIVVSVIVGVVLGLTIGYKIYSPKTIIETSKSSTEQKDGSVVIRKVVDTVFQDKLVKVKDTKIVKEIEIRVVPTPNDTITDTIVVDGTTTITNNISCDTVDVRLNILRNKDNTLSVQAKTTGGEIVGAIDIPKENVEIQKKPKNSAGVDYTIKPKDNDQSIGGFYNRDVGPFVIGTKLGVNIKDPADVSVGFGVGIKF